MRLPVDGRVYALQVPHNVETCGEAQTWLSGGLSGRIINTPHEAQI